MGFSVKAARALFFQYAFSKCAISTILKSVLLARLLFFTAKKLNLFKEKVESQPSLRELMKTLAKLSDKRDRIVYEEKIYKYIFHFIFFHSHLERSEQRLSQGEGSDILSFSGKTF